MINESLRESVVSEFAHMQVYTGIGGKMEAYSDFAKAYDMFMDNINYSEWCTYLTGLLKEYNIEDGLVLELGCGTGNMTELLADNGYDMIGIDNAAQMLQKAMEKKAETGNDILYLLQDMREFELYGTVRAVVSICDSMNYVTEEEDLLEVFRLVNNYLDPGGIFIFDLNTVYKYEELLGDNVIAENREEGSFIWENEYDRETGLNIYGLTLFLPEENGLYRKYEEVHYQQAHTLEKIKSLVKQAGLEFLTVYDAFTHNPPEDNSERIYIICREHGKKQ